MKKSSKTTDLAHSFIPLGMVCGSAIGTVVGIFLNPSSFVFGTSIGAAVGFFIGVIAYALFHKKRN